MFHALTLAAALDGIFTLTDRTDVRLRDPDPITNRAAIDFDTYLDARAVLHARKDVYTLAYLPQLSFLDVNDVTRAATFLNAGLAAAEWNWPRARLSLTESASYGRESFASLAAVTPGTAAPPSSGTSQGQPAPPPTTQLVPVAETFFYESSVTTLASSVRLRPWTLLASIGYRVSGGTGQTATPSAMATTATTTTAAAADAATFPLQKGPVGEASADYAATPRDHLITDLKGTEASFSNGPDDLLVDLEERWTQRWSRATDTLLAGGVAETRERQATTVPYVFAADPVAEATVTEHIGRGRDQFQVRLDARLAPVINPLVGSVDENVQGSLTTGWTHRRLLVQVLAIAGETVDQGAPTAYRSFSGELDVAYHLSEALSFDGGARLLTEAQNEPTQNLTIGVPSAVTTVPFTQELVFVAVTLRVLKAKF
jgi:hypothetical protein